MRINSYLSGVAVMLCYFLLHVQTQAQAQYLSETIRIAQPDYGSTARFKAMGNAQTSLGGDLSSLGGNPAGLGFFNQSDIGFSLDFLADIHDGDYFGTNSNYPINKLGLNQAGVVFNLPTRRPHGSNLTSGWLNFNLGLGYHKTNNFNGTLGYAGQNNSSTFSHFLADQADFGYLEGDMGWESYLVDYNESNPNNTYHYPAVLESGNAQKNILTDKGHQSTTNLAFGANYSNKLYVGASVGFTSFDYRSKQLFVEEGYMKSYDDIYRENPQSDFVDSGHDAYQLLEAAYAMDYNYEQFTKGTGINGTLGIIYKPVPTVNIGLSFTTPTWNTITDEGKSYMDVWYYDHPQATNAFYNYQSDVVDDYLEYTIRTPYRINGGVSTVFDMGLISVDLEYIDYSSMHFSSTNHLTLGNKQALDQAMNDDIRSTFTSTVNVRAGGEYRFTDHLLGRVGFAHRGSPYKDMDLKRQTVSGGLGYRIHNMYIDLTYQNFSESFTHSPYSIDTEFWEGYSNPSASVRHDRHQVFMTLGFKF